METIGSYQQLAFVETYIDPASQVIRVRDSFRLCPSFGVVFYNTIDLGFPEVRASVQDNPQSDGTYDETQYTGARLLTIEGVVVQDAFGGVANAWDKRIGWNSASWFTRYLSRWASPARRFRLYLTDDSGTPRFIDVRGDSFSSGVEYKDGTRTFQLGLVNPSGRTYSFDTSAHATTDGRTTLDVPINQSGGGGGGGLPGRAYPLSEPRSYPVPVAPTVISQFNTTVQYDGTVSNGFTAVIHTGSSPMSDPRLRVATPDGLVRSIGLSRTGGFPANFEIRLDTNERTIMGRSEGGTFASIAQYVIAPVQWPQLEPSVALGGSTRLNSVAVTVGGAASNATVNLIYNSADLT